MKRRRSSSEPNQHENRKAVQRKGPCQQDPETRGELSKLRTEAAKGTLRKKSGKIKSMRRDIARMLTRKREMRK